MTLYEINWKMNELIDRETGELLDYDAFMALNLEKDVKIEHTALWIKNELADAAAMKEEAKKLSDRAKAAENRVERLKNYLKLFLDGDKFSTPRAQISFRNTKAVEVTPEFLAWAKDTGRDDLLTYKEPEPSKTAIKEALKAGEHIFGAQIIEHQSIIIK